MKHRVKLLRVHDDYFDLLVDGVQCSYLIQRPQPLGIGDAALLRSTMDTRLIESLAQASGLVRPKRGMLQWFCDLWNHRSSVHLFGESVASYIEKVGVVVNINKKTKGVVLLKSDVDKIREGKI